ncbi:S41 family peptidase [Chryseobacterium sp. ISL-6]|uniref:S41 family peptidase n=1 Tax=Chryseobacterium sp. ISL-6 TaxID=2819143 RepID=UPI001BE99FA1|nr:S41 family peptidase [Chryseobacterium sp. ISL-6]MBT2622812.1 hypothetical protein [Chryseobacterium sp. ISL-6]
MKKIIILFFLFLIQQVIYAQKEQYAFFMKTWNFLKYYHPDLASGKVDADSLFLANIEKVDEKSDANSIIKQLSGKLSNPISHSLVIDEAKEALTVNQNFDWYKKNKMLTAEGKTILSTIFEHRYIGKVLKEKQYELSKKEQLPLPFRLLILAKIQGSIDYLFPHKYLMDKNFEVFFTDLVGQAISSPSRKDFEIILAKAISKMEDSHAFKFYDQLNYKNEILHRFYYAPFDYQVFNDHLLITHLIFPEICSNAQIVVGDRITEINGKSIKQIINEKRELLSVSNLENLLYHLSDYQRNMIWPDDVQQKDFKILHTQNNKAEHTKITFINPTDQQQTSVISAYLTEKISLKQQHKLVHNDIAYFKINDVFSLTDNIADDKFDSHMDTIFKEASSKKAIVFDMRGYPNWGGFVFHYIYKYFSPRENYFGKYYEPNLKNMGTYIPISYKVYGHYYPKIENKTVNPYKGKVFIIVNPETLSMSEWNTMNLQNIFPQAITIGQQTAGADGDTVEIQLPAGYSLVFTGNGIFYYDNTQTQKVGIRINELIKYTDDDIIQNRDLEFEHILKAIK